MSAKYIFQKKQRKTLKRSPWKILKSFWRRKRQKAKRGLRKISKFYWRRKRKNAYYQIRNENLSEEQKQRLGEYVRNYYKTHNKQLLGHFVEFLKIFEQLHFLFYGLVPEI